MKKLLLLLLLTSCSISSNNMSDEPLVPLATTGPSESKPSINLITSPSVAEEFVQNFYANYTGFKSMPKDDIIGWGKFWCNLMRGGMTSREIARDIRNSGMTPEQQREMTAIFANAMLDLCPSQQ